VKGYVVRKGRPFSCGDLRGGRPAHRPGATSLTPQARTAGRQNSGGATRCNRLGCGSSTGPDTRDVLASPMAAIQGDAPPAKHLGWFIDG
jgi:hypothetical protein